MAAILGTTILIMVLVRLFPICNCDACLERRAAQAGKVQEQRNAASQAPKCSCKHH